MNVHEKMNELLIIIDFQINFSRVTALSALPGVKYSGRRMYLYPESYGRPKWTKLISKQGCGDLTPGCGDLT